MKGCSVGDEEIRVTEHNLEKVNHQLIKGKALVSGLLVGSEACFSEGIQGEIEHKVIEAEHLRPQDFIIPEIPFLSSKGTRRALLVPLQNLSWSLSPDTYHEGFQACRLTFQLPKGSYATALLREFMKASETRDY